MFKLRRYLVGHYAECVLAPLFKMLEALLQLLVPLVMAQVIDVGIASRDASYVLWHGALLVGMGVFAWAISVTAQYFCSKLASAFGTALRDDLFRHVLSLSREDVERLGRATLVTRITNDSQQVQDGLNMFFRLILRSPFSPLLPPARPAIPLACIQDDESSRRETTSRNRMVYCLASQSSPLTRRVHLSRRMLQTIRVLAVGKERRRSCPHSVRPRPRRTVLAEGTRVRATIIRERWERSGRTTTSILSRTSLVCSVVATRARA